MSYYWNWERKSSYRIMCCGEINYSSPILNIRKKPIFRDSPELSMKINHFHGRRGIIWYGEKYYSLFGKRLCYLGTKTGAGNVNALRAKFVFKYTAINFGRRDGGLSWNVSLWKTLFSGNLQLINTFATDELATLGMRASTVMILT